MFKALNTGVVGIPSDGVDVGAELRDESLFSRGDDLHPLGVLVSKQRDVDLSSGGVLGDVACGEISANVMTAGRDDLVVSKVLVARRYEFVPSVIHMGLWISGDDRAFARIMKKRSDRAFTYLYPVGLFDGGPAVIKV